jgi:hypothetical protein
MWRQSTIPVFLLIFKIGKYSKNLLNAIYFALPVVPTVLPLGVARIEKKEHRLHIR